MLPSQRKRLQSQTALPVEEIVIEQEVTEEKLPKPVKPRKADSRRELDEATDKMLAAFEKLNNRIEEINSGLRSQTETLQKLVKTDEKVHTEIKEEKPKE